MKMHQTPDVPGTSPVTDNPNPDGTQGSDTTGPSTGPVPQSGPGPERNTKIFRCADVGFANCEWEARGRNEAELIPQIERHGREQHGLRIMDEGIVARIRRAIREMAA